MNEKITRNQVSETLVSKLSRYYGTVPKDATAFQIYNATILTVKDILTRKRSDFKNKVKKQGQKQVCYLCMEFLIGPSLKNNLCNLGLEDVYCDVLAEMGKSLDDFYSMEPDPGLGNGGLGRLAACFMDSLTTLDYPATGFSILYEYGLFKQKIIDGNQVELPDNWMPMAESWLIPRPDKTFSVRFGGHVSEKWISGRLTVTHEDYDEVQAIPADIMISGSGSDAVSNLRLWRAHDTTNFNMKLFSQGQYVRAVQENTNAEIISKVLYPSDSSEEGKLLRLKQQYFLVSASLQSIISDHLSAYGSLAGLADKVAIHINDTHPALCIPELMRILMDIYSFTWENAWEVVSRIVSYTNHTVLPEALECWSEDLFRLMLPRIYMIISEINRRFCADLWNLYPGDWDRIARMSIIAYSQIKMANLSVVASHTVNGVSKLHSEILKKTVFHDFSKMTPGKFTNVTNGIAHRRWLCYSNPALAALLDECIGPGYRLESERLSDFNKFADDSSVLERLRTIKLENKLRFAGWLKQRTGETIDPNSLFDVQAKRIHEYKRQLLNVLKIIYYYDRLISDPTAVIQPQTFVFSGKAAPGYYFAKDIIRFIWNLGQDIARNPRLRDLIRVLYIEDYNVSTAEILIPATDISEQISLAGKEASGTGCMKFMINGALTIGTLDGANVEMLDAVGGDNIFTFGLNSDEVDELWRLGYDSMCYYMSSGSLKSAIDRIRQGFNGRSFNDMINYFLTSSHGVADPFMCLADFDAYIRTYSGAISTCFNPRICAQKSLRNIAAAGIFSSDRSIREYADKIWQLSPVK